MTALRLLLVLVVLAFMVVTVFHVQGYASSFEPEGRAWLATSYAVAVDASIVACALLTRYKLTRGWAWAGYFIFTAASGLMNAAAVQPATLYAWVYALFPTVSIGLLGFLARQTDALVEAERKARAEAAKVAREDAEARAEERRLREQRNAARRAARAAQRNAQDAQSLAQSLAPLSAQKGRRANMTDVSAIVANMNGNGRNVTASELREKLAAAGFDESPESTLRHWARLAQGGRL